LSDGNKFVYTKSWIGASPGVDGWYVGDFNGDKKCDIMRYIVLLSGSEVFLAGKTFFIYDGSWSSAGRGDSDWYIGDFNGDGRSDLMRYIDGVTGGDVLLSVAGGGTVLSRKLLTMQTKWDNGRWLGDMPFSDGNWQGAEKKAFVKVLRKRIRSGKWSPFIKFRKNFKN